MKIEDLSLLVRALHQDVSMLDERLRRLEQQVQQLRQEARGDVPDLVVIPGAEQMSTRRS